MAPDSPEKHVPGSLQGASPKPEDTVAGGDGKGPTLTQDYRNTQLLHEVAAKVGIEGVAPPGTETVSDDKLNAPVEGEVEVSAEGEPAGGEPVEAPPAEGQPDDEDADEVDEEDPAEG